jgi:tetratricopeptide (TPR) repeat protein
MDKKNLEAVNKPSDEDKDKKSSNISRFRLYPRVIQNFVLVWLDPNISDAPDEEHRDIINQVRYIINAINIFSDVQKCVDFLHEIKYEKAFMIVSGALGQHIVSHIHDISKLDSIYVFCGVPSRHEKWAQNWTKVKGVFTQIAPICDLLTQAVQKCEQNFISLSFVKPTDVSYQNFDQLDPSFMYTQILKEILLEIEYDDQSFKDLVTYCRDQYANNSNELKFIKEFEETYREHSPIYWYTHPGFIYSMLNRALRTLEVDTIIKMGFFIQDLYKEINKLHIKQADDQEKQSFIVYRGQGLSKEDFEKLLQAKGGLMSFNNFLSTSKIRDVSLEFSKDALKNLELVGVLFKMVIDPSELATPYAFIDNDSFFKNDEKEILFSMHTVFRIGEIKQIQKNDRLYQVILTLTNTKNKQLSALTELLRDETRGSTGWHRLGMLLIKLGKFDKAEQVYKVLSDVNTDENEKALLYHQLGLIKRNQGDYTKALLSYKEALNIYQKIRPSDDLDLATTYNNIGQVYYNMGEYSEALSYYEKSFEIYERNLPEDHPTLAISYNNIGLVYKNLGDYNRALKSHEKALEIEQKTLPVNHPSLATSYKNIGLIYKNMGEYSKALSFHEKALDIEQKTLPSNHPSLAISYNNIGLFYDKMSEYSKALSFYEKTLEIYQEVLPPNHPDFAMSFNNIGSVYKNMGEYSKALSFYKKTLDIETKSLLENHPSLAISYNNIGLVYDNMEEYSQALSSHEKALEICRKTLSLEHPMFAILYNNMGSVHDNMGDYKTALTFYKKTLEIEQKTLPPNHPDLATSYNNIGLVYDKLGEYLEALCYHEKALEIYQKTLPSNHPDLTNSYNSIGLAYQKMQEYSKALSFYEKALEIRQRTLPPNHPDLITCYGNISQLYAIMGEHSKALSFYEQLVQAREKTLPKDHPSLTTSYNNIDQIYENNKRSSKMSSSSKPIIELNLEPTYDKKHHITSFRRRLEAIRKKCNK